MLEEEKDSFKSKPKSGEYQLCLRLQKGLKNAAGQIGKAMPKRL